MNPTVIEDSVSIPAGVTENVITLNNSLRKFLNAAHDGKCRFAAVQSAAGLRLDLTIGSKLFIASSEPRVGTDLSEPYDVFNDNMSARRGDQFTLRANNTTAGALTLRFRLVNEALKEDGSSLSEQEWAQVPPDDRTMQRGPVSIADGSVDFQLLDGLIWERPPVPSYLQLFMTASAAGMTKTLDVEETNIIPPSAIAPNNRVPRDPDDAVIEGVEVADRDLILVAVTNRSGGALNAFWKTKLTELARQV